jgi:hypothetical protein
VAAVAAAAAATNNKKTMNHQLEQSAAWQCCHITATTRHCTMFHNKGSACVPKRQPAAAALRHPIN